MSQPKLSKKFFHMAYSFGASIVILGALFKLLHWTIDLGPLHLTGGFLLAVGLITEALVFFLSAFEPIEDDLDWTLVYPELVGGESKPGRINLKKEELEAQSMLSKKLDEMLREAKLDVNLMRSLGDSIQNFKGAAEQIQPAVDSISASKRYSEQLSLAATQMESLNSLYKLQLESTNRQAQTNEEIVNNAALLKDHMKQMSDQLSLGATHIESLNSIYKSQAESSSRQTVANEEFAKNAALLREQMQSMAENLKSLNSVYGAMLTAMNNR